MNWLPDYYAVLGVSPTASADEIKAAFQQTAAGCQLDRGGSYARLVLINSAGAVLTNPNNRAAYDAERKTVAVYGPADHLSARTGNWLIDDVLKARYERAPWLGWPPKIAQSRSGTAFVLLGWAVGGITYLYFPAAFDASPERVARIALLLAQFVLTIGLWPSLGAILHWSIQRLLLKLRR